MLSTTEIHNSFEYKTLQTRLAALGGSTSSADILAAARAVTKPAANNFQAGCEEGDLEQCLWRAWGAIIQFAAETPHEKQDALIEVMKAIRRTDLVAGDLTTARVWGIRVWRGAPVFGACLRESWDKAPSPGESNTWTPTEWTNLNAFAARLTALAHSPAAQIVSRSVSRAPSANPGGSRNPSPAPSVNAGAPNPFDFSLYGLWTLRSAFESSTGGGYNPDLVAAAETWITYAGSVLIKLSIQRHEFEGRLGRAGDSCKENWTGYCRERLNVWLGALEAAKEEEEREGRRGRNGLLDPHTLVAR